MSIKRKELIINDKYDLKNLIRQAESCLESWSVIEQADVSRVTDMSDLFKNVQGIHDLDLSGWDTSNVVHMSGMFYRSDFDNDSIANWNVESVTYMRRMFAYSRFNSSLAGWNTASLAYINGMFLASNVFNQPLNHFDTSKVVDMSECFASTKVFNQDLSNWDLSSVDTTEEMFYGSAFNHPSINFWDVSSVTNMHQMFAFSSFNQPLNLWDVSNVVYMEDMFTVSPFCQDISKWEPERIETGIEDVLGMIKYSHITLGAIKTGMLPSEYENMLDEIKDFWARNGTEHIYQEMIHAIALKKAEEVSHESGQAASRPPVPTMRF